MRIPGLRHHKATGRAVVRIQGKDHYLDPWGSKKANQAKYRKLIADYLVEFAARHQTSVHFGFRCFEIIHAERKRLAVVRQLAALPGMRTARQLQSSGR